MLLVETITDLPDLVNHLVLIAVLALTVVRWWLVQLWRAPAQAKDRSDTTATGSKKPQSVACAQATAAECAW